MDYNEALEFLFRQLPMFSRVGAAAYKPGLETSHRLDNFFGHPHRKFKSIHIAGTNGKGSTSHLIASILQEHGYKTALYTSPHLADFRERIRINGNMIPHEDVIDFVVRFRDSDYDGHPSFFELTMMMAFDWFAKEKVDYAVIEVGMGGRLDSTNIITPEACIITNISSDHTQFLGNTLPEIATEKAGIIKQGIPVVIGEAEGDVRNVFEKKIAEAATEATFAEDVRLLKKAVSNPEEGIDGEAEGIGAFHCPLSGDYQIKNLNTVLSAVGMLRRTGIELSDEDVRRGIANVVKNTGLRGRWTRLCDKPLTICDTGHNEAGLTYNFGQLRRIMKNRPGRQLHIIMGFVADKAVDEILALFPPEARYYLTQANIPRALAVEKLVEKAAKAGISGTYYHSVFEAYTAAVSTADPEDVVFIGGSTFIVADLLKELDSRS